MTIVKNIKGRECDRDAVANLMDDDIREAFHADYEPGFESDQAFFEEYARRHAEKFGEEFAPWAGLAW